MMAGIKDAMQACAASEIMVLSNAKELAAGWVRSMTGGADADSEEEDQPQRLGFRPARLGLGAKFLPHVQVRTTASPVEKKLLAKLNIQSKDTTYGRAFHQQCKKYERGGALGDDRQSDEDELLESRASVFQRRVQHSSQSLLQSDGLKNSGPQRKKRRRRKKSSR